MPIGGEGLEDRIQRSRDGSFWRKAVIQFEIGASDKEVCVPKAFFELMS